MDHQEGGKPPLPSNKYYITHLGVINLRVKLPDSYFADSSLYNPMGLSLDVCPDSVNCDVSSGTSTRWGEVGRLWIRVA